jgi:hypothetical protein
LPIIILRNAALGLGDGGDRTHPDQVIIRRLEGNSDSESKTLNARFSPIHVRQIQMSKLHTGESLFLLLASDRYSCPTNQPLLHQKAVVIYVYVVSVAVDGK